MQAAINSDENIRVLELRNYLLKPNTFEHFRRLFNEQFVGPMWNLGGFTVGQFDVESDRDRFVWLRGFRNLQTRLEFLNDFYLNSAVWKTYRNEANGMMVNSDNVYLLRPLAENGNLSDATATITSRTLKRNRPLVVVDFYVCNSRLEQTIDLFKKEYLPYLKTGGVSDISLWVSEMFENDFPRLPVFQDKNLLVMMATFQSEQDYRSKVKMIDAPDPELKNKMLELVTIHNRLVLHSANNGLK